MQDRTFARLRTSAPTPLRARARAAWALPTLALGVACATVSLPEPAPAVTDVEGGVVVEGIMELYGESRPYRVFVPAAHRPGVALPMLVLLHGCTQTAADVAVGSRMDEVAETLGLLVVYPEQPDSYQVQRCWRWYEPAHRQRDVGEPASIAAITREVAARYGTDGGRVYVAGISAGALMALSTALAYPELYAAVGVHSGGAYGVANDVGGALALMRNGAPNAVAAADDAWRAMGERARLLPLIVLHGGADEVVQPRNADDLVAQWRALAAHNGSAPLAEQEDSLEENGRAVHRLRYRNHAGDVVIERWMIAGLGHAWSGGSPEGSYSDPQGPHASRAIVRFLLEHRRP